MIPCKNSNRCAWARAILQAQEKDNWNVTHTADDLNISRATLQNKMKKYGLPWYWPR